MTRLSSWVVLSLSSLVASTALAQEAPPRAEPRARILATAGIAGRFGEAVCEGEQTVVPHPSAAFSGALLARGADPGALVVDTGGLLAPHGVTRFANRDYPGAVVELVASLGYRALALGENDLGAPRPRTIQVAAMLRDHGIPYVASNLRCEGEGTALCDAVRDAGDAPLVLEAGALRVGLLALLDPSVLHRVAPDRSAGLTLAPIEDALPSAVRAARAAGAELVAVVLDSTSDAAFDVARALPADARPDLVLLATEGDDLIFARPATVVPAIVSPAPGGGVEVRVGEAAPDGVIEMRAVPLTGAGQVPAEPVHVFARAVGPPYCAAWGTPLPGGHLARELDAEGIALLSAQMVRELAGADVALLNVGAVESTFRVAEGARLTGSDLYVALEFDEPIVVADVPASWLFEAQGRLAEHGVVAPGLTTTHDADDEDDPTEDELRIRGRPAVTSASYRVATIRFLAMGGDDALPELPEGTRWTTLEYVADDGSVRYQSLRDVVLAALGREDARDPRDARPSPDDPPEWIVRGQVDGDFSGSTVDNDGGYSAALLDVESSVAMGVEVDVHVDATVPLFTWENQLVGRYRSQWAPSSDPMTAGEFVEAADQVQLRSLASYRGLRSSPDELLVPDLYVEVFMESEFTQPDSRDYHWLLFRPTAGVRFPLALELDAKLQLGMQTQLLDPMAEAELGAGASLLLRPWTAIEAGERAVTVEGLVDFFAYDLFDQNRWQLRGQLDVGLDLAGPLAVTFGTTLYMQQEGESSVSIAVTATAGLRLAAVTRAIGP